MDWLYRKYREIKLRRRTDKVLRATGVTLTDAERQAVSSDQYIYWTLLSWPDRKRTGLCACLWALVHNPTTFEHYRPTNRRAAGLIVPDPALRECPEIQIMGIMDTDYRLLRRLYARCLLAGVKTCTVHDHYRGPAPQPERDRKGNETHKTIHYHPANQKRADLSHGRG